MTNFEQKIGFALITHTAPEQVERLARCLVEKFSPCAISCHHDFTKSTINFERYPTLRNEVAFVKPIATKWADFSVVDATIAAIKTLIDSENPPGWIIVLTGSDYPLQSRLQILSDLQNGGGDVYIDHREISGRRRKPNHNAPAPSPTGWKIGEGPYNQWLCSRRYFGLSLEVPVLDRTLTIRRRRAAIYHPAISHFLAPFDARFRCFSGLAYFTLNFRAAKYLVIAYEKDKVVKKWYKYATAPDESYFHSILCNASNLTVVNNSFRYVDWSQGESSPKTLTLADKGKIITSGAHFGRKVSASESASLLDFLDARLALQL